jgi:hypothetical protein
MEEGTWKREHGRGNMEEGTWKREHGRGNMKEWREHTGAEHSPNSRVAAYRAWNERSYIVVLECGEIVRSCMNLPGGAADEAAGSLATMLEGLDADILTCGSR